MELLSLEALQELAQAYGYWAIGLGIMLENAGVPLPGETITLVGGFLAGDGELEYWKVLASAAAGAVVGDSLGYWFGVWGGWPLLLRIGKLFRADEDQLMVVREQFARNAVRAVILGRFVALLRIFAGPLAGISGMPYLKFLACNVVGAIAWASTMVSLAFFAGRIVPLAQLVSWTGQFALLLLLLVAVVVGLGIWRSTRQVVEE
ncbi:MAG: DedA family protein [Cyanobacteria bacterium P01_A01_bin.135]